MPRTDPDPLRIRPFSNEKRRARSVPRSAKQTGGTAVGGSVDPGDLELMARGPVGPGLKPRHWAPLLLLFRRLLPFCGGRQYYQWNRLAKPFLITCSARRMAYPAEPPWAAQWIPGAWSSWLEARWSRGWSPFIIGRPCFPARRAFYPVLFI